MKHGSQVFYYPPRAKHSANMSVSGYEATYTIIQSNAWLAKLPSGSLVLVVKNRDAWVP